MTQPGDFPDAQWMAGARARWSDPARARARARLEAFCDAYHAVPSEVPDRQAGYYHEYFCPDHAVELRFDLDQPTRHVCPTDGRAWQGPPFDGARLWFVNDRLSDAALQLALRGALAPDGSVGARDRATVVDILVAYAQRYTGYQRTSNHAEGYDGIATFSALDESVWVSRLVWAFGLVRPWVADETARVVTDGLFAPAAAHLWKVRWPAVHNMTVWNDAALIALALVLRDGEALREAIDGHLGLRDQLERGIREDGTWWEGSLSYHYYTLAGAVWAYRTLRAAGVAGIDDAPLRRMFEAPLGLAWPDLTLPAMNDCWYDISLLGAVGHGIPTAAGLYTVATSWGMGDAAGAVLDRNRARRPIDELEVLLDGDGPAGVAPPAVPSAVGASTVPIAREFSGLVVLRQGEPWAATGTMLIIKAGEGRHMHGHPDQLAIQLYACGGRFLDDLGTPGYGVPLSTAWYEQTASHSTLLVDGASQPTTDGGRLSCTTGGGWARADAAVAWSDDASPYAGVEATRRVAMGDGYILDVLTVTAPEPRSFDLLTLPRGKVTGASDLDPTRSGGFAGLAAYAVVQGSGGLQPRPAVAFERTDGARLWLCTPPGVDEDWILGSGPANPATASVTVFARRRVGRFAQFVSVLVPRWPRDDPARPDIVWATDLTSVTIDIGAGARTWSLAELVPHPQPSRARSRHLPGGNS